jgi:two-component system response regulator (stage 0 sporulation protein A)
MESINKIISNKLKVLGIPANLKGYRYIGYGIELIMSDTELMDSTMNLYMKVAERFNITITSAERAIRHAIDVGWNRGHKGTQIIMFGYSIDSNKGKPTNSEFLATVADYLLMEFNEEGR